MDCAPVKATISLDVLDRVDVRVGTIDRVEEVEKSKSLVKLHVDFGDHRRIILAGIKEERDDANALEGRQALFVVNLEPRKMMGHLSQGMLFDIGYSDGIRPALAVPEVDVPNGARAG